MKIVSYNGGGFYDATLTPDGVGTYDINATFTAQINGGPEGLVYVSGANAGFGVNSILVSEYGLGSVAAYDADANGDPIAASRRVFLSGLNGAEGAVIDPLTGDFIFSTFGGGNSLFVINGFVAPPNPGVPEPATWAMLIAGFGMAGASVRLRVRKVVMV
ncbi:MAG: PEPxxWA-CTERM sorting domain-containing protein [Proteobacteria bacterium]|nr:PEPxxWA-CTERM sorting domain-containing protein [Pseudomonadota bacterium]